MGSKLFGIQMSTKQALFIEVRICQKWEGVFTGGL